jgi:pimeloyl-ACP methyl ester carboxylesterase
VRLIAPDRPGIRSSSERRGYRVIDVGHDIVAAADVLGEHRFGVLGYSAGGPYALATALVADQRLLGVVVAAGMGPPDAPEAATHYPRSNLRVLRWSRERPRLARMALGTASVAMHLAPGTFRAVFSRDLAARDRELRQTTWRGQTPRDSMRMVTEAFRGGGKGVLADCTALAGDWGFLLQDVRARVRLWQGDDDRTVAPVHARNLMSRLPACDFVECPGDGHLLIFSHGEAMLRQAAGLE